MNKIKFLLISSLIFLSTISFVIANEFIGVVAVGIGDISNQKNEKLITGSKIYFGDTIMVKEKSNAQILLLDETALTIGEKTELTIDDFVYDPQTKVGKIVSNIKVGTPVRVTFPSYNDTSIHLNITNVGNYIEPTNRTFRIMASIKNNNLLLPNMLAEVSITDLDVKAGLVISSKSLLKDQNNVDFVYIATKKDDKYIVSQVNVIVIEKFNGKALLKSGSIQPGIMIVAEGAKGIAKGDIVRAK